MPEYHCTTVQQYQSNTVKQSNNFSTRVLAKTSPRFKPEHLCPGQLVGGETVHQYLHLSFERPFFKCTSYQEKSDNINYQRIFWKLGRFQINLRSVACFRYAWHSSNQHRISVNMTRYHNFDLSFFTIIVMVWSS